MLQTALKVLLTSILVVASSEAAKRNTLLGAILVSLPLTSILAMLWLYADTRDPDKVAAFTTSIFWMVLPSLTLFIALPILLRRGLPFAPSLLVSIALTVASYWAMVLILRRFGIEI